MKPLLFRTCVGVCLLSGCATHLHHGHKSKGARSETVLVTYHVQSGKEVELEKTLAEAWNVYREGHLVYAKPHLVLRQNEGSKTRFLEIFTWVDRKTPEHAPEMVLNLWKREEGLCEKRDGHYGIEPVEVNIVNAAREEASR